MKNIIDLPYLSYSPVEIFLNSVLSPFFPLPYHSPSAGPAVPHEGGTGLEGGYPRGVETLPRSQLRSPGTRRCPPKSRGKHVPGHLEDGLLENGAGGERINEIMCSVSPNHRDQIFPWIGRILYFRPCFCDSWDRCKSDEVMLCSV